MVGGDLDGYTQVRAYGCCRAEAVTPPFPTPSIADLMLTLTGPTPG